MIKSELDHDIISEILLQLDLKCLHWFFWLPVSPSSSDWPSTSSILMESLHCLKPDALYSSICNCCLWYFSVSKPGMRMDICIPRYQPSECSHTGRSHPAQLLCLSCCFSWKSHLGKAWSVLLWAVWDESFRRCGCRPLNTHISLLSVSAGVHKDHAGFRGMTVKYHCKRGIIFM